MLKVFCSLSATASYSEFEKCVHDYDGATIFITLPVLKDVVITGVGNVSATNSFDGLERLNINSAGVGSVTLDVEAQEIITTVSGVNDVSLSGSTVNQEILISGLGNYFAFPLASQTCKVVITGAGRCEVSASDVLDITISGSGNVYYKGDPDITVSITGTGKLVNAN